MATTDKKPSFGVALGTFVIIAAIIAYGLLGLGMDAHVPIAMAATAAALIGKFVVGVSWEDMEIAVFNAITSSLGALLILITIGMLVGAWVQAGVLYVYLFTALIFFRQAFSFSPRCSSAR